MFSRRTLLINTSIFAINLAFCVNDYASAANAKNADAPAAIVLTNILDSNRAVVNYGGKQITLNKYESLNGFFLIEIIDAKYAVFESFGFESQMLILSPNQEPIVLTKTAEATKIDFSKAYMGLGKDTVANSPSDIMGDRILNNASDPNYGKVVDVFPPLRKVWTDTYNFLGTPDNQDKVWFMYGGRSPNFDPAVFQRSIEKVRTAGEVFDGLVGGYLPFLRFVYPEENSNLTEMVAFAPFKTINDNKRMQPIWYRVSRIENDKLVWVKYVDSYLPFPPRESVVSSEFYTDLLATKNKWDAILSSGTQIIVPDKQMENMAKHSLIRMMMTRSDGFPKYGIVDKNYGGSEHDGFPDTFCAETSVMLEWGLMQKAAEYIENYFSKFVRDDGAILYRGPETGQFGRMLTIVASFIDLGGDANLILKLKSRIDGITNNLLSLRAKAKELPRDRKDYGMISAWSEADSILEPDPQRYMKPYFSNSLEAARGFRDLGNVWVKIGKDKSRNDLIEWGNQLQSEASELAVDITKAIEKSMLNIAGEKIIPSIANSDEPFHIVLARDRSDPQWRAYRAYMEMAFSGLLSKEQFETILNYRKNHHDIILGMPMAYGLKTLEIAGFLSYGHGYGLIQFDYPKEALLMTYSIMAHQYTRGMWMAPETRRPFDNDFSAPYCSPAQSVVPFMLKWIVFFEDPIANDIFLLKATPRDWYESGKEIKLDRIRTRWGEFSIKTKSDISRNIIEANITLPKIENKLVKVRIRAPLGKKLSSVTINGRRHSDFSAQAETITLPANINHANISARYVNQ